LGIGMSGRVMPGWLAILQPSAIGCVSPSGGLSGEQASGSDSGCSPDRYGIERKRAQPQKVISCTFRSTAARSTLLYHIMAERLKLCGNLAKVTAAGFNI
jgi:hypothetical protein